MTNSPAVNLADYIRDVADFPKPGIMFKDITPLLASHAALEACIFLFAVPLAMRLGIGMVPIRKPGKLPYEKKSYTYDLEYGTDTLEMHVDAVKPGEKVLVVDDLLATGGTVSACCEMVEEIGAEVVGCAFLIHLAFLDGAKKLGKYPVFSLVEYS